MKEQDTRTISLIGPEAFERLSLARIAIFGIGGVGSYVAEACARAGIGGIDLIDSDRVEESNLNRQIIALHSTIGEYKTDVMRWRILDINPEADCGSYPLYFSEETVSLFDFSRYQYIVDCIDSVTSKLLLIKKAKEANVPILCSMGTGNKLDPTLFRIADISKTSVCPLARVMRREIRKRGWKDVKVLFSTELPHSFATDRKDSHQVTEETDCSERKLPPATISYVPSAAGLMIAGEVLRDIAQINTNP